MSRILDQQWSTYTYYINHHKRTQIIGSNWISDNVSEKIAGKIGTKTDIYMKI